MTNILNIRDTTTNWFKSIIKMAVIGNFEYQYIIIKSNISRIPQTK